ncbi:MAG: LysM peptidoglycan-binding domain-containing protein [Myxococcota bacterium]
MSGMQKLEIKGGDVKLRAHFNPAQITLSRSVIWQPQPGHGQNSKKHQHSNSEPRNLSFDLFFDAYEKGPEASVQQDVYDLLYFTHIGKGGHPPICTLTWGRFVPGSNQEVFKGYFKQVSIDFTMFQPDGAPCRAKAKCTMIEYDPIQAQEARTKTKSPDHAKVRTVRRGETLQSIAYSEYDSPGEWRRIADFNNIDNPMLLEPGTELLVPPILRGRA